jgi:integrase
MCLPRNRGLPFAAWPRRDRELWQATFEVNDLFADPFDDQPAASLSPVSRTIVKNAYVGFLGFVAAKRPELLALAPDARLDRKVADEFAVYLRRNCRETTIAIYLEGLHAVFSRLYPQGDWSWLRRAVRRIRSQAKPRTKPFVPSDRLWSLGLELMQHASAKSVALLLAEAPIRRGSLAKLRIGHQLVRSGDLWALDIPADETKTRQPEYRLLSPTVSAHIDIYLAGFRNGLSGASLHDGLWPSLGGRPMSGSLIAQSICRRTLTAFGFAVSPHRFRDAAATTWSIHNPKNVRGAKDLLGHKSFEMTEKHYIMAHSRMAGQEYAQTLAAYRDGVRRAA